MLPLAMTTSHTKNVNEVLHFDEILKTDGDGQQGDDLGLLPSLNIFKSPPNDFSPKTNDFN